MKYPKRPAKNAPADEAEPVDNAAEEKAEPKKSHGEDDDFVKTYRKEYEAGYNRDRENQDAAYQDLKFIAGEGQWDSTAENERTDEGRPVLVVNQCPQFVRQVTGDMRQMKPAIKVVPVDDKASKDVAAKLLPGMVRYIEQRSDAAGIYFQAADQQVGCGIGHWMVTHEYASQRTFNQEIRIVPVSDGVAVVWDADSVLPTREDAMCCFVPWDMSADAFKEKYPDATPDPLDKSPECFTNWFSDDHVRVAIYFKKKPVKRRLAVFPDGKIDDVTDAPEDEATAKAAGAKIEERDGFKVCRYVVSAREVLEEDDEEWPGPDIPVVPVLGEEVKIGRTIVRRGVVRPLRDIQRIFNYAISTQTEVVALQPKAPFLGTRKQFEKYVDQWETANTRNWPYLEYEPDPAAPGPPQRSPPPIASTGLDELIATTQANMNAVTGIYPSALGKQSNEVSGKAIMARDRQSDTGTYVYHDNFQRAQRRSVQIVINMIPQIYDTARTIQIVGDDGKLDSLAINQKELGPDGVSHIMLNDVTIGAYEVALEMGPSYSTKREESREGMTQLFQALGPEAAAIFVDLFVKAQDWPLADKIAERAKFLLPPAIRQKEAQEAGEQPPPEPPPPPPTPEQQQAMAEEQKAKEKEMLDRQQAEADANRKHELAVLQIGLDEKALGVKSEQIKSDARKNEMSHEDALATHAVKATEAQHDPRVDQLITVVEKMAEALDRVEEQIGEFTATVEEVKATPAPEPATPPAQDNALHAILEKLARRPSGAVRTKDGMKLVYDEEAPPPIAPAPAAPDMVTQ